MSAPVGVGGRLAPGLGGGAASVAGSLRVLSPAAVLGAAIESRRDARLVLRQRDSGNVLVVVLRAGQPTMVFAPGDGRSLAELLVAAGRLDRAALERLVDERSKVSHPLHDLVPEHTRLSEEEIQAVLDYQARQRLLDALVWSDGSFQLEERVGGGEAGFSLRLPSLATLVARAEARANRLPVLLALLPAAPENTLVRRRRSSRTLLGRLEDRIASETAERRTIPGLLARLLVDDDLALEAALAMAERGDVVLEPLARLVQTGPAAGADLHAESLVREIRAISRRPHLPDEDISLWFVVVAPQFDAAAELVCALGSDGGASLTGSRSAGGICRAVVRPVPEVTVSWLAVHPGVLNEGALAGVMGRCDGVVLVRGGGGEPETDRLKELLRRLLMGAPAAGLRPPVLGLDVASRWRRWDEVADASLGVPGEVPRSAAVMRTALLEGMLAAARSRGESERGGTG